MKRFIYFFLSLLFPVVLFCACDLKETTTSQQSDIKEIKVLSIGNSFSRDAHRWLNKLANQQGVNIETANLYIGGCSLEIHWKNVVGDNANYQLELNGGSAKRKISFSEALEMQDWDVITLQQVSDLSGLPDSYEPYLSDIVNVVREAKPNAKIFLHQTWAYEIDSKHRGFANYNNDQQIMYDRILSTTQDMAKSINAEIIPAGTAIQQIREKVKDFDYANGGISLCKDGYHLTDDYGRFAVAATWFRTLTGRDIKISEFESFDKNLLNKIINVVNSL